MSQECKYLANISMNIHEVSQLLKKALEDYKSYFFEDIYYCGLSAGEAQQTIEFYFGKGKLATCILDNEALPEKVISTLELNSSFILAEASQSFHESLLVIPAYLVGVNMESIDNILRRIVKSGDVTDVVLIKQRMSSNEEEYNLLFKTLKDYSEFVSLRLRTTQRIQSETKEFETYHFQVNK